MSDTQLATPPNAASVFQDPGLFERAMTLCEVMAKAKTIPKHLQGSPGDLLRVVELAFRTNQSPYALADKTFLVGGKISFEGQLCAALLNSNPVLSTRLDYKYTGEGTALQCLVTARIKGEDKDRKIIVAWKDGHEQSPSNKALWQKQPEQQLAYWGARVWGRRHAPEVLMGIYTPDELEQAPEERAVTARVVPPAATDRPALPPTPAPAPAPFQVLDKEAPEEPVGDLHEELLLAMESDSIGEGSYLFFASTGKTAPKEGYQRLEDIPEATVKAMLTNWERTSKAYSSWKAKQS